MIERVEERVRIRVGFGEGVRTVILRDSWCLLLSLIFLGSILFVVVDIFSCGV